MACFHYSLPFLELLTNAVTLFKKAMLQAACKTDFLVDNMTPRPV